MRTQESPTRVSSDVEEQPQQQQSSSSPPSTTATICEPPPPLPHPPPVLPFISSPPPSSCQSCVISPSLPPLIPPFRHCMIESGLYRGAYPSLKNLRYMKRLNLRTMLSLIPITSNDEVKSNIKNKNKNNSKKNYKNNKNNKINATTSIKDLSEYCKNEQIHHIIHHVDKYDDGKFSHTPQLVASILSILIDPKYHPLFIHCRDGAHNTGIVVMCLRRLQNWTLSAILDEFIRYTKTNDISFKEKQFVESFHSTVTVPLIIPTWLWDGVRRNRHPSIRLILIEQDSTPGTTPGTSSVSNVVGVGSGGGGGIATPASMGGQSPSASVSKDLDKYANFAVAAVRVGSRTSGKQVSSPHRHYHQNNNMLTGSRFIKTIISTNVRTKAGRTKRCKGVKVRYTTQLAALDVHGIDFLKP